MIKAVYKNVHDPEPKPDELEVICDSVKKRLAGIHPAVLMLLVLLSRTFS